MSNKIPDWVMKEYLRLRAAFGLRPFTVDEASRVLDRPRDTVITILSVLKRNGLISISVDQEDTRRRLYVVKSFTLTRGDLESVMKKAADLIRTRVDYSFILVLLFYKKISDKWKLEYEKAMKRLVDEGLTREEASKLAKEEIFHEFRIPEDLLWDEIVKHKGELHVYFSRALKELVELNPPLRPIFDNFDFHIFASSRENQEILRQLVELFDGVPLLDTSPDVLGDAYEWLLMMFAPTKAKEGEVYTPREVIRLLVEILQPRPGDRILDPAAGSGGMLIVSYKYVEERMGAGEADKLFLFGQEANPKTAALAKMNMYIHDISNNRIEVGDSLINPKFGLGEWDIVLANPPWNQDGYGEQVLKRNEKYRQIFRYGYTPSQTADWAWIQLMLAAAAPNGRVGLVIDNGTLFRGGKEKRIRSRIVEADLVEAVILLPEKLFYNTQAPGAVIIFNKQKPPERKNKILFINASSLYEKHPTVRRLNRLGDEHIKKIVDLYREFKEELGFSYVAKIAEVRENDYNLNVTLYVTPIPETEEIDLEKVYRELLELEKEMLEIRSKAIEYIEQIIEANRK